ncbi:MAG TPA: aminotransferase class V-fold PLP-dependent enzyme [Pyrinomonadaceae bacterium]|nr:aminotransferase class V-fold PLP-dependent enzyme [Pyrinomonadaceae bacterium]
MTTPRIGSLSADAKRDLLADLIRRKMQRWPNGETPSGSKAILTQALVEDYRRQFPALDGKTYFNYGAHGTLPRPAIDAVLESWEYMQKWGPFSAEINDWAQQEVTKTIACLATLLVATPETIALTENATAGCNVVLWGLEWREGDHILISDCENPGIVAAIQEVARRFRLQVSTFRVDASGADDSESATTESLARGLRSNTRLVVISHVLWNTGQVLPLTKVSELCRANRTTQHRTLLLVDGAQSVGVLPLNLARSGADFYAFTSHKWLCGPEGVGGLFVAPESLEFVQPAFVGWRSVKIDEADGSFSWQPGAKRFHVSTPAYPLFAGWRRAISIHDDFAPIQERYDRIRELSRYVWERLHHSHVDCLQQSPPETGLVTIRSKSNPPHKIVRYLETQNCYTRSMYDPECIRLSLHYFTTHHELDRLIDLLQDYEQRKPAKLLEEMRNGNSNAYQADVREDLQTRRTA